MAFLPFGLAVKNKIASASRCPALRARPREDRGGATARLRPRVLAPPSAAGSRRCRNSYLCMVASLRARQLGDRRVVLLILNGIRQLGSTHARAEAASRPARALPIFLFMSTFVSLMRHGQKALGHRDDGQVLRPPCPWAFDARCVSGVGPMQCAMRCA